MHQEFLTTLQQNLADRAAWLVYADWLEEQGDPTCAFIRLSLELTAGHIAAGDVEARVKGFEQLYPRAHVPTRELLALYRASLPVRFRVLQRFFIGHNPPQEMFGYARTITAGFLEAGTLKLGADLGVGTRADGQPRLLQVIMVFNRDLEELVAGREPIQAGLGWLGHLQLKVGSVLTVAPAATA